MSTAEIAKGLVELCRQGKNEQAVDKYYADNIVSVEAGSPPGMSREMSGIEAVRGKNTWWLENHEVHAQQVAGPFVGDDQFAVWFRMDVTPKASGKRFQMEEMGLYTVKDGKIAREQFYYNMS